MDRPNAFFVHPQTTNAVFVRTSSEFGLFVLCTTVRMMTGCHEKRSKSSTEVEESSCDKHTMQTILTTRMELVLVVARTRLRKKPCSQQGPFCDNFLPVSPSNGHSDGSLALLAPRRRRHHLKDVKRAWPWRRI